MAEYQFIFDSLGLRAWCDQHASTGSMSMADLVARASGETQKTSLWDLPFPSLDALNEACRSFPQSRDLTRAIESGFLAVKDPLKVVLDPLTQPLSWALEGALIAILAAPWFVVIPFLLAVVWLVSRSASLVVFVFSAIAALAFVDHFHAAMQTLSIVFVCAFISVLFGAPIGIAMSRSNRLRRMMLPVLDLLQTLPTFVYLIPLIFLFSVAEPKLYGIAIILYAIVPIIRLTDLGIRLVNEEVLEAAEAYGMTDAQKLFRVQIPLALPNIMAGLNQTIMMSLSMVVIASLVSAPGLGVLVLRGIRNLELGVGLVAGLGIVLLAIVLDRTTKAALDRVSRDKKR